MISVSNHLFHLTGKNYSYILEADTSGRLFHRYYGRKLKSARLHTAPSAWHCWDVMDPAITQTTEDLKAHGFYTGKTFQEPLTALDTQQMEYPCYGYLDMRSPAISVQYPGSGAVSDLKLVGYEIVDGALNPDQLPGIRDEESKAQTLILTLQDAQTKLEADLFYVVFDEEDCLTRRAVLKNCGDGSVEVNRAFSMSIDLPEGKYDVVSFPGRWAKERNFTRQPVNQGEMIFESNRGGSSHTMNPFVMVCQKDTTEDHGEVYASVLEYSGNHKTVVSMDQYGTVRFQQGISDWNFGKELSAEAKLETPCSILSYSADGFSAMSRNFHQFIKNHIVRPEWRHRERPILINNWEATYFDFNEEKLLKIAAKAAEIGIELFVLDDGWFGKRNIDNCSLGDWVVNTEKLPDGLTGLSEKIEAKGLKFGIWMEPEMVNPDSDLYRAHPDWVIRTPLREPAQSRAQLVLDLSRTEVQDYIIDAVSSVLSTAKISYLKWDMNRNMTDMPREGYNYEYYLGFYRVLEVLMKRFPDVLFEGCSGGGGRFDLGILYYMPQIWTSDDTDAIERLSVQMGTSYCYPVSAMGSHVTAVPNHQTGRITPLATRGTVAGFGNFGYELDITKLPENELEEMKQQIEFVKANRHLVLEGDYYRLSDPEDLQFTAFELISNDGKEIQIGAVRMLCKPNLLRTRLKLKGLNPERQYQVGESGEIYNGDELLNLGIELEFPQKDFASVLFKLQIID